MCDILLGLLVCRCVWIVFLLRLLWLVVKLVNSVFIGCYVLVVVVMVVGRGEVLFVVLCVVWRGGCWVMERFLWL